MLTFEAVLAAAGELPDSKTGWQRYADHLAWLAADEGAQKELAFEAMSRGWALGGAGFKQALVQQHKDAVAGGTWDRETGQEARELVWQEALKAGRRLLGKSAEDAMNEPKAAAWKVALAAHLKASSTVSNPWLGQQLNMGAAAGVSRYVAECRKGQRPEAAKLQKGLSRIKV
jgi:putative transposase